MNTKANQPVDLKQVGLKVTQPRTKILAILESQDGAHHLSADDIYKILIDAGEKISIATVYRVLIQFETAGLVIRHNFESGHSVFEIDSGKHHDHLVCIRCGRVEEFVNKSIEQNQRTIAEEFGYEITDHILNIYGLCPVCKKNPKPRGRASR